MLPDLKKSTVNTVMCSAFTIDGQTLLLSLCGIMDSLFSVHEKFVTVKMCYVYSNPIATSKVDRGILIQTSKAFPIT